MLDATLTHASSSLDWHHSIFTESACSQLALGSRRRGGICFVIFVQLAERDWSDAGLEHISRSVSKLGAQPARTVNHAMCGSEITTAASMLHWARSDSFNT